MITLVARAESLHVQKVCTCRIQNTEVTSNDLEIMIRIFTGNCEKRGEGGVKGWQTAKQFGNLLLNRISEFYTFAEKIRDHSKYHGASILLMRFHRAFHKVDADFLVPFLEHSWSFDHTFLSNEITFFDLYW